MALDGTRWAILVVPDNIGLLHLPPYSPELNPVENVWEFLRHNDLSNRIYATYEAIVDACCNRLEQTHRRTRTYPLDRHSRLHQNGRFMSRLVLYIRPQPAGESSPADPTRGRALAGRRRGRDRQVQRAPCPQECK
jgi:hypothetical protein